MRPYTLAFRLSTATALAGLMLAPAISQPALAQPVPPGTAAAVAGQQTGDPPERAGWLSQISGTVSFHAPDEDQWAPATMNYPVATGDGLWTQPDASAQIMISDSRIALAGGTELDLGTLDQAGLQATVPQGEVFLRLRNLAPNEAWVVQTPRGLVTFSGAGRYDVVAGDTQGPTTVTVLAGSAQVAGPGLSLQIGPGQTATITGADTFQGSVGPVRMDAFLTAAQQAERPPPAPAVAPPAVVAQMPGGDDLSVYGSWSQTTEYGDVWYPQVAAGWVPYREGHWAYIPPWGWTWVDDAPWGFTPFHYGRWIEVGGRWGWTPGLVAVAGPPVYAPALVAFIGLGAGIGIGAALEAGSVGWVPLGPREVYHPWYHASEGYLRSVNQRYVTNVTAINERPVTIDRFANRGAATVVPARAMTESRPVRQVAEQVDPRMLATARPVIGTPPIRPTAATVGVTPGLARRMQLASAPAGVAAVPRAAPGPAIHAVPLVRGVAARPALRGPVEHTGVAPEHAAARPGVGSEVRPGVGPEHAAPGARPGVVAAPGAVPERLAPAEREAHPPPAERAAPRPEVRGAPAPEVHAAPRPEVRAAPAPEVHAAPRPEVRAAPAPEVRATPRPEVRAAPAPEVRAAPRPEVRAAPAPEVRAAPRPEVRAAPAPEVRAAPAPEVRATPRPEVRAAPAPEVRAAPRPEVRAAPAPEVRAAPRPEVRAAPRPEVRAAPAPEVRAAPRPEVRAAPAPEVRAAPAPEVRAAPAPRPAPAGHEEKRPEER